MVWEKSNGPIPKGMQVHHKNHDKLDNSIGNLELMDALTHKRHHSGCKLIDGEWWKPCRKCRVMKIVSVNYYHARAWIQSICKDCQIQASIASKNRRSLAMKSNRAEKFLCAGDAAVALGVTPEKIRQLVTDGKLNGHQTNGKRGWFWIPRSILDDHRLRPAPADLDSSGQLVE